MKKSILLLVLSGFMFSANAQRGYVESAIRKNYEKKYGESGAQKGNDWFNNKLLNVDVADSYTFATSVKMHITNYKNGVKKEERNIQYYFNSDETIVGFKTTDDNQKRREDQFIIYDYIKNAMIMLNEKDHTGVSMNINAFQSQEAIDKRNEEMKSSKGKKSSTTCKEMSKTKTIRGYVCKGYTCYDTETDRRSEVWITTKISFNTKNMDARNPLAGYYLGKNYGGMMLEGNFYKGDQLTSTMEVLEVNTSADYTVNTKDYTFHKM